MKPFAIEPDLSEVLTKMVTVPWSYANTEPVETDGWYSIFEISDGQKLDAFELYSQFITPALMCLARELNRCPSAVVWRSDENDELGAKVIRYGDDGPGGMIPVKVTITYEARTESTDGKTVYQLEVVARGSA